MIVNQNLRGAESLTTIIGVSWFLPHFVTDLLHFPLTIYDFIIISAIKSGWVFATLIDD